MKQKKFIVVKLIGIGNNKDDDKNEKDDKDYNNDDEKSKSNYEYEVMIANIRVIKVVIMRVKMRVIMRVIMRVKIVYINVLMRLVSITPGHVKLD